MFTGRPVLVGHTECQRGQAEKRNSMLAEEEGHGKGRRRQAGRRRLGARPGCPLIGGMGGWGSSGPAAGSDPQPKQTYLRGLGDHSFPTQMESKANRNPAGPSCDPCPQTQQAPLTLSSLTPHIATVQKISKDRLTCYMFPEYHPRDARIPSPKGYPDPAHLHGGSV